MSPNSEVGAAGPPLPGAASYAVCTPGVLPADQIAFVETIHRKFLQSFARRLGETLETPINTDLVGIEQMQFSDFLSSCDANACQVSLNAAAGTSRAILELSPGFLHRVLAMLIGAPENSVRPERGITGIERHILSDCIDALILDLRETWAAHRVNLGAASIAEDEEQAQLPVPEGGAVVVTSVLQLGGSQESMRLAVPALMVRLAAVGMHKAKVPLPTASRPLLVEALRAAGVEVEAILGGPSLRMRDLLALSPGQVLMLGPPANCSVECVINGVSKFRGELVSNGRNQAFQVESPIEPRTSRRD
jgi:flagellar motor switch protein FliM